MSLWEGQKRKERIACLPMSTLLGHHGGKDCPCEETCVPRVRTNLTSINLAGILISIAPPNNSLVSRADMAKEDEMWLLRVCV